MANEYIISVNEKNKDKALEELTQKMFAANKKLDDEAIKPLSNPIKTNYKIDCSVEGKVAPDFSKALQKVYESNKDFEDAEKKAKKGYGNVEYVIKSYTIDATFDLKDSQKNILMPKSKSTPSADLYGKNNSIDRKIFG